MWFRAAACALPLSKRTTCRQIVIATPNSRRPVITSEFENIQDFGLGMKAPPAVSICSWVVT